MHDKEHDLQGYVDEQLASGVTPEDLATKLDAKADKKEAMAAELRAKAEELRSGSSEPTA